MSHSKRCLQDAQEALGLVVELVEVDRLQHEGIGASLEDLSFILGASADGDDGRTVRGIGLDTPADVDTVDAGDFDIEDQQVGFDSADFDQGGNSIRCCRYLKSTLVLKEGLEDADDVFLVVHNEDLKFVFDQRRRHGNLMLAEECEQVISPDPTVSAGCPIGRKKVLFDPVNYRQIGRAHV